MNVNRADISQVLTQMREMKAQAQGVEGPAAGGEIQRPQGSQKADAPQFGDMFKSAIDSVNELQQTSGQLAQAYERGDSQVSLSQVMVASQKASVSFQAVSQVRNRLVEAYKDVMNMPV